MKPPEPPNLWRPDITRTFREMDLVTDEQRRKFLTQGLPAPPSPRAARPLYIIRLSNNSIPPAKAKGE